MMAGHQYFSPSSSVIFLFFSLSSSLFYICHAHDYSPTSSEKLPSLLNFVKNLNGTPRKGDVVEGLSELKKYLENLGYIDRHQKSSTTPTDQRHDDDDSFDDTLESAVKKYQRFYNLKVTGVLDQGTLDLLSRPRCGVPDHFPKHSHAFLQDDNNNNITDMRSLYSFLGTTWPPSRRHLMFSYPKYMSNDANNAIVRSLMKWTAVSPFVFGFLNDWTKADIKISFERGDHGDGAPFDGRNGVLAHSFAPTDGRLHFDADELWQTDSQKGDYDLQSVALHELGHILGLGHSSIPWAVMYPHFAKGEARRDLTTDDIQGIHVLYPS